MIDDFEIRRGKAAARLYGDPEFQRFLSDLEQTYTNLAMFSAPGEPGRGVRELAQAKFAALQELRAEFVNAAEYGSVVDSKLNR